MASDAAQVPVLECRLLTKRYGERARALPWPSRSELSSDEKRPALQGVSLSLRRGECLGILGESGCGKTTLVRCLSLLERPTSGSVFLNGQEISSLRGEELRRTRHRVQVVFQDPYASLNPRQTIGGALAEVLRVLHIVDRSAIDERVGELLEQVGLPRAWASRYPSELSGGGRRRVSIARAIAAEPDVLLADEAVSALDASVQAQVLNLLLDLRERAHLSMVFVSHNVHVLEYLAQRTLVMFGGRVVEEGSSSAQRQRAGDAGGSRGEEARWLHPYTRELLSSVPVVGRSMEVRADVVIGGAAQTLAGCPYRERCRLRTDHCVVEDPELHDAGPGHRVACHEIEVPAVSATGVTRSEALPS